MVRLGWSGWDIAGQSFLNDFISCLKVGSVSFSISASKESALGRVLHFFDNLLKSKRGHACQFFMVCLSLRGVIRGDKYQKLCTRQVDHI